MDVRTAMDEGYSEDTRSQADNDSAMGIEQEVGMPIIVDGLRDAFLNFSEAEKSEHIYHLLLTLRTSSLAAIVERLRPRLHIDPVPRLPPELTHQIFSYLSPRVLIEASKVSTKWRERALDSGLWRQKFLLEGWSLDTSAVKSFEESFRQGNNVRKSRSRRSEGYHDRRHQKTRSRFGGGMPGPHSPHLLHRSLRRADAHHLNSPPDDEEPPLAGPSAREDSQDAEMPDADVESVDSRASGAGVTSAWGQSVWSTVAGPPSPTASLSTGSSIVPSTPPSPTAMATRPPSILLAATDQPRLDFRQVYRQKCRLEENWMAGRYTSFQLPHHDHPKDAHTECVYTIQYAGRFLVSGSRDRTIRIWDLDTQRLVREPLRGHTGSVLCLQFDASESEDVIVSGSSDTHVIIWQFSTGKMIHKLLKAHDESVLNVKFDRRFLVTCSKDKLIKIWNRRELAPGHPDYPVRNLPGGGKCPAYIVDLSRFASVDQIYRSLTPKETEPLPPFTLLMKIDQHNAAVNAVHIYEDHLVSASGDRNIKVWDIHTGVCTALCKGHTKGIACVQFDGKRIVSGSSDDTIRIFDPLSRAEVACLRGHTKLVRTVHAAFADPPGAREAMAWEARRHDRAHGGAMQSDLLSHAPDGRILQDAGLDDPTVAGATLPAGGGGSGWARIVSGSYDETIIIWKRDGDGRWVPLHTLKQADALRAAGGPIYAHSELAAQAHQAQQSSQRRAQQATLHAQATALAAQAHSHHLYHVQQQQQQQQNLASGSGQPSGSSSSSQAPPPALAVMPSMQTLLQSSHNLAHAVQAGAQGLHNAMPGVAALPHQAAQANGGSLISAQFASYHNNAQQLQQVQLQFQHSQPSHHHPEVHTHLQSYHPPNLPPNHAQPLAQHPPQTTPPHQPYGQAPVPAPVPAPGSAPGSAPPPAQPSNPLPPGAGPPQAGPGAALPAAGPPNAAAAAAAAAAAQANARVFKLQFDARRIICCSQDPKIVGWDFAHGDEAIIECSKFFGPPV